MKFPHLDGATTGSSPRVRGTPKKGKFFSFSVGIIPACAGNTTRPCAAGAHMRDHPRVCGEHHGALWVSRLCRGSSPRVRGTRLLEPFRFPSPGIIPACAGNTGVYGENLFANRDHPRVCGEHLAVSSIDCLLRGSSPRVRGTHKADVPYRIIQGIIPACAGNTSQGH